MNTLGFIGRISCALLLALLLGWAATHILSMEVSPIADGELRSEMRHTIVWLGGVTLGGFLGYRYANQIIDFITTVIFSTIVNWVCSLWS